MQAAERLWEELGRSGACVCVCVCVCGWVGGAWTSCQRGFCWGVGFRVQGSEGSASRLAGASGMPCCCPDQPHPLLRSPYTPAIPLQRAGPPLFLKVRMRPALTGMEAQPSVPSSSSSSAAAASQGGAAALADGFWQELLTQSW